METMTATELNNILAEHKLWLETKGKQGQRANLEFAYLAYANLTGAYLENANLAGVNLEKANLEGANLTGTILEKKVEKQPKVSPCKVENTRQALEKLAKEHGFKIDSISLSFI